MNNSFLKIVSTGFLTGIAATVLAQTDKRPNIIVILADDLGYSDLGCYGGEIHTPNLDKLASEGLRFSNFYNASRSCPTRASLLTGLYQHQAGIGRMTFNQNLPGYQGTLSKNAVTIAEMLKSSGYNTAMVGKWHISETKLESDQTEWLNHKVTHPYFADINSYPTHRGFDKYYGIIYGVADYFDPFSLVNQDTPVNEVPKDYYITNALADTAIAYVNTYAKDNRPFFMYLAFTAPHWPLHALPEDIKKYEEVYKPGWDFIRNERYERIKKLHIFGDANNFLSPRFPNDDWDKNPNKEWDARAMTVHAAMVDRMDQEIGELIKTLKMNGQYENTLILFLSDNGASSEMCQNFIKGKNDRPDQTRDGRQIIYPKNKKDALPGEETTFSSIGPVWANVSNTPFRFWKAKSYEGGICTPFIAHWPDGIMKNVGKVIPAQGHVIDIMATCIDLARAKYPEIYNGNKIIPLEGQSLLPIFKKGKRAGHEYLGFEHINERAFIGKDGWKIVKRSDNNSKWELYNLNSDRSEMIDLASKYPEKISKMVKEYKKWAKRCLVVPAPKNNKSE